MDDDYGYEDNPTNRYQPQQGLPRLAGSAAPSTLADEVAGIFLAWQLKKYEGSYKSVVWLRLCCKSWNQNVLENMKYLLLIGNLTVPCVLWREVIIKLREQPSAKYVTCQDEITGGVQLELEDQTLPEDRREWTHEEVCDFDQFSEWENERKPLKYMLTVLGQGAWAHSAETLDLVLCKPEADQFTDHNNDAEQFTFFNTAAAFFGRHHGAYMGIALPKMPRGEGPIDVLRTLYRVNKCVVGPLSLRVERLFTGGDDFMEGSYWFEKLQGLFDDLFNALADQHLAAGLQLQCGRDGLRWRIPGHGGTLIQGHGGAARARNSVERERLSERFLALILGVVILPTPAYTFTAHGFGDTKECDSFFKEHVCSDKECALKRRQRIWGRELQKILDYEAGRYIKREDQQPDPGPGCGKEWHFQWAINVKHQCGGTPPPGVWWNCGYRKLATCPTQVPVTYNWIEIIITPV